MLFKSEIDIIKGGIPYENVTKLWKSSVPYLSEYTRFDIQSVAVNEVQFLKILNLKVGNLTLKINLKVAEKLKFQTLVL